MTGVSVSDVPWPITASSTEILDGLTQLETSGHRRECYSDAQRPSGDVECYYPHTPVKESNDSKQQIATLNRMSRTSLL